MPHEGSCRFSSSRAVEGRETAVGATHRGWVYPHQNGASLFGLSTLWSQRWSIGGRNMQRRFYITMLTMVNNQITEDEDSREKVMGKGIAS
jgi:hypothetical protein